MSNPLDELQQAAAGAAQEAGDAAAEVAAKELGDQAQQVLRDTAAQAQAAAESALAKEDPKSLLNKIINWFKSLFGY